jgi:sec-independent protein translocase protein TatA
LAQGFLLGGRVGVSGTELILILLVALLLFGAKNLPKIARNLGRTLEEFRRAAHEVKREIAQAEAEAEPPPRTPALPDKVQPRQKDEPG